MFSPFALLPSESEVSFFEKSENSTLEMLSQPDISSRSRRRRGVGFQQRWRRNVEGREEVLTLPKSPAPPLESREGLNVASAFCAGLWTLERHAHKIRASPEREVEPYECLSGCGSSSCRGGGGVTVPCFRWRQQWHLHAFVDGRRTS